MILQRSLPAACGCFALLLACPTYAASDITVAAIATGRLYVLGTTDQPHTKVRLDDKFDTVSDGKGLFQFELVYHPSGCIVRAAIGDKTVEAVVGQCGEVCKPAQQANAPQMPKLGSAKLSPGQPSAPPTRTVRPGGMAFVAPEGPGATNALPPAAPAPARSKTDGRVEPTLHAPLPPPRPKTASGGIARPAMPTPSAKPPMVKSRLVPKRPQQATPDDRPSEEPLDAPETSDVY